MAIGGGIGGASGGGYSSGYNCGICGGWVDYSSIHVCPGSGTLYPTTTTTTFPIGGMMKHINWQEYVPARPPSTIGDYLFVFTDYCGKKILERGTFTIDASFKHKWTTDKYVEVFETVTHYALIELP